MLAAAITFNELRRHVPAIDCSGKVVACSCGWRLKEASDDFWCTWVDHLYPVVPKLPLTEADLRLLKAAHIKL